MSENHQIHSGPGLVHDAARDRHFQDTRTDKHESYPMGSTENIAYTSDEHKLSSYHKQLVNLLHHQLQAFMCRLEYRHACIK